MNEEMIDQNDVIRLTYSQFDKFERVIHNRKATNLYKNKKGLTIKVLEIQQDNQVVKAQVIKHE